MRRLAQHAIAGIGFSALVVAAAVAGLGSPAGEGSAIAVPAPVTSVAAQPVAESTTSASALAAEQAARVQRSTRAAQRAQLVAQKQAAKRAATLGRQGQSIEAQQAKLKAAKAAAAKANAEADAKAKGEADAKAKAKAEAAAAKEARARVLANRGYEPGTTDPKEMARQILKNKYGYSDSQFSCFNNIIIRESMWKVNATNPSSGAYGIPQALPGSKMASAGSDWRTNPATQIIWGVDYMKKRYGSPCEAWSFKRSHGWY